MSNLTSKKIAALLPHEKRYSISIDKGLTLRVHPSGNKSFVVRLPRNGRVFDITIGHFPDISLAQAKHLARKQQKDFDINPIKGYSLRDGFILWCNKKRGHIVSYKDEKHRLERYVIKPLGSYPLDEITPPLIIKTVAHIEREGKQATLKRVLMRVREIFDLCVFAGYIESNPLTNISKAFAPAIVHPMPSISWEELPDALKVLSNAPLNIQLLFLFSLCSMLRPGEIAKLQKDWIQTDTIVIPATDMKKRRCHRVPISSFMASLLTIQQKISTHPNSKYIFVGRNAKSHISKQALAKWLHCSELKGQLVAHGLRSIARGWLADNGISFEISESCLSHCVGDRVYRAYQRSDFLNARRPIMERWSTYVATCADCAGLLKESSLITKNCN